jgi:hypothetical protein
MAKLWSEEDTNKIIKLVAAGTNTVTGLKHHFPDRSDAAINGKIQRLKNSHGKALKFPISQENLKASDSKIMINS